MHTENPPDIFSGDISDHQCGHANPVDVANKGCLSSTTSNLDVSGRFDQVAMDTTLNSDGFDSISVDVEQVWDESVDAQSSGGDFHNDDMDTSGSESLYADCQSLPDVDRLDLVLSIDGMYIVLVRFLHSIGRIDDNMAQELLESTGDHSLLKPTMRSGLYILRHLRRPGDEELFVIYWPEDTTWDDSASSNDCRNRVTFMSYLTKMCDQLIALISPEHASAILWNTDEDEYTTQNEDLDMESRLVTFDERSRWSLAQAFR
ncbi:hypothetical protein BDN67DRAFT_1011736 [Paxillus ammoniavirescens]|nr:hypothetical protein BDN67DRAFT_1011736 [Paxillus ammoniavirescens]